MGDQQSMYQVMDAAFPPAVAPRGVEGIMGYLASPAALHSWEPHEWLPFAHLRQFPTYVPSVHALPRPQAQLAVAQAKSLGWAAHLATWQRVIILDMETSADPEWYDQAAQEVSSGGFIPVAYGSASTVLGNAASDVLVAAWNDVRAIPAEQTVHGAQYAANVQLGGTVVDYSLFDAWLFNRGGVNARRQ